MYKFLIVVFGILYIENASAYVLHQNRQKNDNLSNSELTRKLRTPENDRLSHSSRRRYNNNDETNSLESIVLAIDTGVKQFMSGKTRPDIIDNIGKTLVDFIKYNADHSYRSQAQEYNIKPEIVHLRSSKPSVMFEINSKSIIKALRDMLQSKAMHKYMDKFTKEAAVAYRTLRREFDRSLRQHN